MNDKIIIMNTIICCAFIVTQPIWISATDTLIGHLMPLGKQRPPSISIDEFTLNTAPTPQQFFKNYINCSKAAIFRGVMKDTKAFKVWSDEYIKANYGDLEVRLEGKKEKGDHTPIGEKYLGRDTLRHFVDHYHEENSTTYIVSELPKQMFKDVGVLPSLGVCGEMGKTFVEIDLWWSGGNSKSVIHKDAFNQINCLYRGTKYWKLFEYKYEKWLHKHWEPDYEVGGFSDINVEAVDLIKHPNLLRVPWSNFTIHAGDCLFLPKSYYHQVDSDGPENLAVSILFSRFDEKTSVDTSDCNDETDYTKVRALSEYDVMWQWEGKGVMTMGFGDLEENYRSPVLEEVANLEKQGKQMTVETLVEVFPDGFIGESNSSKVPVSIEKAFAVFDADSDGVVTADEVRSADFPQLRKFGWALELYEPSNSYDFEYTFISYELVKGVLDDTLLRTPRLSRQQWIAIYINQCAGTKEFANEIFTGLVQSEDQEILITSSVNEQDVKRSLKNWIRMSRNNAVEEERPDGFDEGDASDVSDDEDSEDEDQLSSTSDFIKKEEL